MYGVCKVCGCTDKDPCFNPEVGYCWWVDDSHELCRHCANRDIYDDPATVHCVNSTEAGLYVEETTCDHPELQTCDGCPRYIEDEDLCDLEVGL